MEQQRTLAFSQEAEEAGGRTERGESAGLLDSAETEKTKQEIRYRSYILETGLSANETWVGVEKASTYGAALMVPQVARSAGWPISLTIMTLRSFFFLGVGVLLQLYLLNQVGREETVMSSFAGQMHLCDFFRGGRGPAGTIVTAARTYDFATWSTRVFTRDTLKQIFPDLAESVDDQVDPGEYAVESMAARLVCCFLFMIVTFEEVKQIRRMGALLWHVPTRADSWISGKGDAGGGNWLARVNLEVAGIPLVWKVLYFFILIVPKTVIWYLCCTSGIQYLLESATIYQMLLNSLALSFILQLDESVCQSMMKESVRVMLAKCKGCHVQAMDAHAIPEDMNDSKSEANIDTRTKAKRVTEYEAQALRRLTFCDVVRFTPLNLVLIILLTGFFMAGYYHENCDFSEEGQLVSKPMRYPLMPDLSLWGQIWLEFGQVPTEDKPWWVMPKLSTAAAN